MDSQEKKIKINWEGSLFCHHSLAMVNREFLTELTYYTNFDIRHIPYEPDQFKPDESSKYSRLTHLVEAAHPDADIHIRHRWPPDFSRPSSGKFIAMQPWEYGSLPVEWRDYMNSTVDEVWVYTHYLKKCYIRSGVDEKKIVTVPLGIDPDVFRPGAEPFRTMVDASNGRYTFLFNGGVTLRKGVDILVNAYLNEFSVSDNVCLVIKDSCAYAKNLSARIEELSKRTDIAKVIYLNVNVDHYELPSLYAACDCYIHPYRAEGYGLPIAEALACDKPVIVTGGGSCLDFVDPDMAYFVKCSVEHMGQKSVSDMPTVDFPFWFLPDMVHLQKVMRYVFDNKEQAIEKGIKAGEMIRLKHTWTRAAKVAAGRFNALGGVYLQNCTDDKQQLMLDYAIKLLKDGSFTDASELFTMVLQNYGDNSMCYEGLGLIAFQQKRYSDSFEYLKIANRISPDVTDILLNWSEAARRLGNLIELRQPLLHIIKQDPHNAEITSLAREIGVIV
ncbi:MAG: glycosyltransferase [Fibrobacterota bacterium]|nr:glycosyltransferase [Chitinispirillaceae bacterium]